MKRRQFSSGTGKALGASSLASPWLRANPASPNETIQVGIIGACGKGRHHIRTFLEIPQERIAALCDADSNQLVRGRRDYICDHGESVKTYQDARDLLDDPGIDAVVIATPSHWHALLTVWACQAGKDVYVEKPVSHNVWEGRLLNLSPWVEYDPDKDVFPVSGADPAGEQIAAGLQHPQYRAPFVVPDPVCVLR